MEKGKDMHQVSTVKTFVSNPNIHLVLTVLLGQFFVTLHFVGVMVL